MLEDEDGSSAKYCTMGPGNGKEPSLSHPLSVKKHDLGVTCSCNACSGHVVHITKGQAQGSPGKAPSLEIMK